MLKILFSVHSILIFCSLPLVAQPCGGDFKVKTFDYPFVIKGAPLSGFSNDGFAAYVFKGNEWSRIPIQIDEVNSRGDYVLSDGLPYTKDTDDGFFDFNDELVVNGFELGQRADLSKFPKSLLENVAGKWWVDLCGQFNFGSFLLLYYSKEKPFYFPPTHVPFDFDKGLVSTEFYEYKFNSERAALLGQVFLKSAQNETVKVFEQSYFVMPLYTPWYIPDFELSNENFVSTIESWQTGPIRSIVAVGVKLKGFLSLFDFHMFSELVFYRNKFEIPTMIEFTMDPVEYFKPGSGIGYSIQFDRAGDWPLDSNIPPLPRGTTDNFSQTAKADSYDNFHASSSNSHGSFLIEVSVDPKAAAVVPPPYLFNRDTIVNEGYQTLYPWLKNLSGDIGVFVDFSQVRKGIYKFGLDLFLSSGAKIVPSVKDRPKKAFFQKL